MKNLKEKMRWRLVGFLGLVCVVLALVLEVRREPELSTALGEVSVGDSVNGPSKDLRGSASDTQVGPSAGVVRNLSVHAAGSVSGQPLRSRGSTGLNHPKGRVLPVHIPPVAQFKGLKEGMKISMPSFDGETLEGNLNYVETGPEGVVWLAGDLIGREGTFFWKRSAREFSGMAMLTDVETAIELKRDGDRTVMMEKRLGAVLCRRYPGVKKASGTGVSGAVAASASVVPLLYSVSGEVLEVGGNAVKGRPVLYLDFDGEVVTHPRWNGGKTIVAARPNLNESDIRQIVSEVAADFSPFKVVVTTDVELLKESRAAGFNTMRCIVTPTSDAATGAGGVAFLNSFEKEVGESDPLGVPCWAFNGTDRLSGIDSCAMTISHELGHTFGLVHDGDNSPAEEYNAGFGSGAFSWGPIMGAPFGKKIVQWSMGEYAGANNTEDDLAIIRANAALAAGGAGLGFQDDETDGGALPSNFGLINHVGVIAGGNDADVYRLVLKKGDLQITASPVGENPNLDIKVELLDENGNLVVPGSDVDAGMILVKGGALPSGSPLAGQSVQDFQIGKYEVQWGEFQAVRTWAAANGYDIGSVGAGDGSNYPVTNVSWYQAVKWCNARSEKEGKTPVYTVSGAVYRAGDSVPAVDGNANGYRLPLEAEWEWAARGGVSSLGYTYSGSNTVDDVAWYTTNSGGATKAVGTKAGNELGIYDMSGNVGEWCWDASGANRLNRGGSWVGTASHCSVARRISPAPTYSNNDGGFRVATSYMNPALNPSNPVDALDASISYAVSESSLTSGQVVLKVRVSGVGRGNPANGGYSTYGSIGAYRLVGSAPTVDSAPPLILDPASYGKVDWALDGKVCSWSLKQVQNAPSAFSLESVSGYDRIPPGCSFDSKSGEIRGVPSVSGVYRSRITARNSAGKSDPFEVEITVRRKMVSESSLLWVEGVPSSYRADFGAVNPTNLPIVYSISPSLPGGLSFDKTTGVLSGTVVGGLRYSGVIQATGANGFYAGGALGIEGVKGATVLDDAGSKLKSVTARGWKVDLSERVSGLSSMVSEATEHGSSSWMRAETKESGWLTFSWKVDSDRAGDFLHFIVNGRKVMSISGNRPWQEFSHYLSSTSNVLEWVYEKDASEQSGRDCGWVDSIQFGNRVSILTHPKAQAVTEGSAINLSCSVTGSDAVMEWLVDGRSIAPGGRYSIRSGSASGVTQSTLRIEKAILSDVGAYSVKITSRPGARPLFSERARVTVTGVPRMVRALQPASVASGVGGSVSFTASYTAGDGLVYEWSVAGVKVPGPILPPCFNANTRAEVVTGPAGSTLRISNLSGRLNTATYPVRLEVRPKTGGVRAFQDTRLTVTAAKAK